MEREPSLKSPDLAAIFGKPKEFVEGKAEETYEEDNSFIPGQVGPAELIVSTVLNPDDTVSEVLITRQNSLIPSTLTKFSYDNDGRANLVENYIYLEDSKPFLVERVDSDGNTDVFPDGEVKKLVGMFIDPVPEKISDLAPAIEKAKEVKHPAVQIIKEGEEEVALVTKFSTYIDHKANYQNTSLEVTLYRFKKVGERLVVASRTRFNLRGLYINTDPTISKLEFLYDGEKLVERKHYVQGELTLTDTFVPRTVTVFDFERELGEWAKKEKGKDKELWRAQLTTRYSLDKEEKIDK